MSCAASSTVLLRWATTTVPRQRSATCISPPPLLNVHQLKQQLRSQPIDGSRHFPMALTNLVRRSRDRRRRPFPKTKFEASQLPDCVAGQLVADGIPEWTCKAVDWFGQSPVMDREGSTGH